MRFYKLCFLFLPTLAISACEKSDIIAPLIILIPDTVAVHYLGDTYIDPGINVTDNYTCDLTELTTIENDVDVNNYGTYIITYTTSDEAGNTSQANRLVDIVLRKENYYHLTYAATDTCNSGIYFYNGLIQDCACPENAVTVVNISNLGLSAIFTLPVSGLYNEIITLDTLKAAITFNGSAVMSTNADTLFWNYTIADSVTTDICRSVWIKQ